MSATRPTTVGRTRVCPHCKATILDSSAICPGCSHHLRFGNLAQEHQRLVRTALRVEGTVRHQPAAEACEYSVVIEVRNERGEQVSRQVVGVGALQPQELRTFTLSVDLLIKK